MPNALEFGWLKKGCIYTHMYIHIHMDKPYVGGFASLPETVKLPNSLITPIRSLYKTDGTGGTRLLETCTTRYSARGPKPKSAVFCAEMTKKAAYGLYTSLH